MAASRSQIGILGLGTMGENLALNVESKGFIVSVYNRTIDKTKTFIETNASGKMITPTYSLREFVDSLETPRRILVMVKAGPPVDEVLQQLTSYLSRNDIVIDGGNSHFRETERRARELEKNGIQYLGLGISGGKEGALTGPCLMPGGPKEAYELVKPILTKVAARVDDGVCCSYLGPGGAGHYVKMVHNGIEYAIMALISEVYDALRTGLKLDNEDIRKIFRKWNRGDLDSYLINLTGRVLGKKDEPTGGPLIDIILDKAGQKGTGRWTSQDAMDLGVPLPTIDAAVAARNMSNYKDERLEAAARFRPRAKGFRGNKRKLVTWLKDALYASMITSYAQGMKLLEVASVHYGYNLNLAEIARIWSGGCIIRAKLLDKIKLAYQRNSSLPNLLLDTRVSATIRRLEKNWRLAVRQAKGLRIPCPAVSASLDYLDSYTRERLPANLIQALRDCFGSHQYERVDKPGYFHTEWLEDNRS